jgi:hypothetical protein
MMASASGTVNAALDGRYMVNFAVGNRRPRGFNEQHGEDQGPDLRNSGDGDGSAEPAPLPAESRP